jgi:hypothetical protein
LKGTNTFFKKKEKKIIKINESDLLDAIHLTAIRSRESLENDKTNLFCTTSSQLTHNGVSHTSIWECTYPNHVPNLFHAAAAKKTKKIEDVRTYNDKGNLVYRP